MSEPNVPQSPTQLLRRTPLYSAHVERGARLTAFAGYEMPVQYPPGILAEHAWTRGNAGLFDISHMGQAFVIAGNGQHVTAASALEALVPGDLLSLHPGQQRYTQLLNEQGGVIDDLMVTRSRDTKDDGSLMLIVNAARKEIDFDVIRDRLPQGIRLEAAAGLALLALQGPKAAGVMAARCPPAARLCFMQAISAKIDDCDARISRSGYTGEDGFEISVAAEAAERLWRDVLRDESVEPCGLGARDSLRLDAGLCLYGHELDETISPVEAGLAWSIQKRRREHGGFPGAARVQRELADGPKRRRVGVVPEGRAPAREGTEILSTDGDNIGVVTSGGFSPTLRKPVAMGYVAAAHAVEGTPVKLVVRGQPLDARIVRLPFVAHNYRRDV